MLDLKKEIGRDGEIPLENVVVYFTAKDQSSADLYADEFKCLMTLLKWCGSDATRGRGCQAIVQY